jgi:hypothetical protein
MKQHDGEESMNPISIFFVQNIVPIFFFYGLAFFALGLALALASRRASEFTFVRAIRPLAAFGLLHGLHEWIEMFQKVAEQSGLPPLSSRVDSLIVLVLSCDAVFMCLRSEQSSPGCLPPILKVTVCGEVCWQQTWP